VGCPVFYHSFLQPFEDAAAAAIRAVDRSHIVVYEPEDIASSGTTSWLTAPTPAGSNIVYSFHVYCAFHPPAGDATFCGASESYAVNAGVTNAARLRAAPFMTEFGGSNDLGDLVDIARGVDFADQARVGWIYWEYKASFETPGAKNAPGYQQQSMFDNDANLSTLRKGKVEVLSEPYPTAIAGIPIAYQFDHASRTFSLAYTPDRSIKLSTVVFAAPRNYPGGYRVEVDGARVTSPPCAPYLTLTPLPGVTRVSLKLFPGNCASP
jgi:endoglycosylceramidase